MAVIIVEPADSPPVRYQGRVHIRIGPRKGVQVGTGCRAWETRRRIIVRVSDAEAISSRGEKSWVFPGK
jgi:ATP-dependent DNA helicase RecG